MIDWDEESQSRGIYPEHVEEAPPQLSLVEAGLAVGVIYSYIASLSKDGVLNRQLKEVAQKLEALARYYNIPF